MLSSSASESLNAPRTLSEEKGSGSKRSARNGPREDGPGFGEYLEQAADEAPRGLEWLPAIQLQNFLPNLMMALPGLSQPGLSSSPHQAGPGARSATMTRALTGPEIQAQPEPRSPAGSESPDARHADASAVRPDAGRGADESTATERQTDPSQTERAEASSNRDLKEAEARKETEAEKSASSASEETEAAEEADSLSSEAASDSELSGDGEDGDLSDAETLQALTNAGPAEGAPNASTQSVSAPGTEGSAQAVGNAKSVEGVTGASNASAAVSEVEAAASVSGPKGAGASASPTSAVDPAGVASGNSTVNGNTPSSEASETAATPRTQAPQVPEQILKGLRTAIMNGDREIQIQLDPPELGHVRLKLTMDGESLRVVLESGSELSRQALNEALPDLRRVLQQEGFEVEDFVVQDWQEEPSSGEEGWDGPNDGEEDGLEGEISVDDEYRPDTEGAQFLSGIFHERGVNMVA